jgi:hypothetical protein
MRYDGTVVVVEERDRGGVGQARRVDTRVMMVAERETVLKGEVPSRVSLGVH